nr:coiled-coil domain-containing protein 109, C-terminal [Tanacetum cinerariifolium]
MMGPQVLNLLFEMMLVLVDKHRVLEVRLVAEQNVRVADDIGSDWSRMERSCMCQPPIPEDSGIIPSLYVVIDDVFVGIIYVVCAKNFLAQISAGQDYCCLSIIHPPSSYKSPLSPYKSTIIIPFTIQEAKEVAKVFDDAGAIFIFRDKVHLHPNKTWAIGEPFRWKFERREATKFFLMRKLRELGFIGADNGEVILGLEYPIEWIGSIKCGKEYLRGSRLVLWWRNGWWRWWRRGQLSLFGICEHGGEIVYGIGLVCHGGGLCGDVSEEGGGQLDEGLDIGGGGSVFGSGGFFRRHVVNQLKASKVSENSVSGKEAKLS